MNPFAFVGQVPASKSILNRLLLAQSYAPGLKIGGDSRAEDVVLMRAALNSFSSGAQEIFVGSGGTVLRFMALRCARESGDYVLRGSARLFSRPLDELVKILRQLGSEIEVGRDFLRMRSTGWRLQGDTLLVPFARSSQFASSVLLNAWDLPMDLFVSLGGQKVSEGYWRMSVRLAQDLGMKIDFWDGDFRVPRGQKVTVEKCAAEMDMSSAFVIAALAAVNGSASLTDIPETSLQPDAEFIRILAAMGVPLNLIGSVSKIERASRLNGVAVNLRNSPDLFPVLSVLCALAEGESHLYGAEHLAHKESNRIVRMAELARNLGREVQVLEDGLKIGGVRPHLVDLKAFAVDPDQDHRVAFAAAVARAAGAPVSVLDPECVNKSFPEFWSIAGPT